MIILEDMVHLKVAKMLLNNFLREKYGIAIQGLLVVILEHLFGVIDLEPLYLSRGDIN